MGKLSVDGMDDVLGTRDVAEAAPGVMSAAKSLMRSKGFVWIATSRTAAYFMSHAGQFLEMVVLGRWWADIPRAEWPADAEEEIMVDYDPATPAHGDRRQELVFIGQFANDAERKALEEVLDACLLTDDEFALYEQTAPQGDDALRTLFFGNK
jgi:G3E family GTPase